MNIVTFFTSAGNPATGLTPTIKIRKVSDNSLVIDGGSMSEIGDGFYKYSFAQYSGSVDYVMRTDGGGSLAASDRYQFAGNENFVDDIWDEPASNHVVSGSLGGMVNFINDIQGGRWKIVSNQMIFYKDDNTTEVARFNLFDDGGVPTMSSPFERYRVCA